MGGKGEKETGSKTAAELESELEELLKGEKKPSKPITSLEDLKKATRKLVSGFPGYPEDSESEED